MSDALAALLGALIGASTAMLAPILVDWVQRRALRLKVASAFAAEIGAIVALTREMALYQELDKLLGKARSGEVFTVPKLLDDRLLPDPVFDRFVGDVGVLGPDLARQTLRVYRRTKLARFRYIAWQGNAINDENRSSFIDAMAVLKQELADHAGYLELADTLSGLGARRGVATHSKQPRA
jgi:hypothetical protein